MRRLRAHRFQPSIAYTCVSAALLAALVCPPASGQTPKPAPPAEDVQRSAQEGPIRWAPIERSVVMISPTTRWIVIEEEATPGVARSGQSTRDIRQTRIRIAVETEYGEADVAVVQHLGNQQIEVFDPEDERLFRTPRVSQNPDDPWPNTCGISFHDTQRPIDLNLDGRNEIALRFYATVPDEGASGLALIEETPEGTARLLPANEVIGTIRAPEAVLSEIFWDPRSRSPLLVIKYLPLEDCRFLAQLQIRGELDCRNCCRMPVILSQQADGLYHPGYISDRQKPFLERLQRDIAVVSAGKEKDEDLSSAEKASLARMAAFFYLTGTGRSTRTELGRALGPRGDRYKVRLFVDELESYFLAESG